MRGRGGSAAVWLALAWCALAALAGRAGAQGGGGDGASAAASSAVCGVVALFNPAGYLSRPANFAAFRERSRRQGLWLLAVELALDEAAFVLERGRDCDMLVRMRGSARHVLWQKERLLQVGLELLPARCEHVVWPDGEVLFAEEDWVVRTSASLAAAPVAQPFSYALRLPRGVAWMSPGSAPVSRDRGEGRRTAGVAASALAMARRGRPAAVALQDPVLQGYTGFAWAARRELLREVGFYDAAVFGGGDTLMAHAWWGHFAHGPSEARPPWYYPARFGTAASPAAEHFRAWAVRAFAAVQGSVGAAPGTLLHLWHGDKAKRRYRERFAPLIERDFDPDRHLRLDALSGELHNASGTFALRELLLWAWAVDASEPHVAAAASALQLAASDMFAARDEDEGLEPRACDRVSPN
jgi:hypothetical protein